MYFSVRFGNTRIWCTFLANSQEWMPNLTLSGIPPPPLTGPAHSKNTKIPLFRDPPKTVFFRVFSTFFEKKSKKSWFSKIGQKLGFVKTNFHFARGKKYFSKYFKKIIRGESYFLKNTKFFKNFRIPEKKNKL
jgi:hypothetical protein